MPPGKMGCGAYGASVAGPGFGTSMGAGNAGSVRLEESCARALVHARAHNTGTSSPILFGIIAMNDKNCITSCFDAASKPRATSFLWMQQLLNCFQFLAGL